jgi:purine-binding chemotaxis protein CheW
MPDLLNPTEDEKYMQLILDGSFYGVPLSEVLEILEMTHLTELPFVPNYVKGVMNLRGKMIPVIDLSIRFGQERNFEAESSCIVVFQNDGKNVGVIVDAMGDIVDAKGNITAMEQRRESPFIMGVICGEDQEDRTMLLNMTEVFKK